MFGVGERMITARSEPVFGGVYKLAAVEDGDGKIIPKIKVSENLDKITIPHFKKTYRIFDKRHRQGGGGLHHRLGRDGGRERPTGALRSQGYLEAPRPIRTLPQSPFRSRSFREESWSISCPPCPEIQAYCRAQVDTLWDTVKRFENPHTYYVDLSQKLFDIKQDLLCRSDDPTAPPSGGAVCSQNIGCGVLGISV